MHFCINNNFISNFNFTFAFATAKQKIEDNAYNGQVRKYNDGELTQRLDIYLEEEWRPICTNELPQFAADSACRQLGYTHSKQIIQSRYK